MNLVRIYKDAFAGLSREVWMLSAMMLINRIGTLILPFLVLYTTEELHWTSSKGGIAASSFGIGSLAGAFVGGKLTDAIGYYKTMLIGLIGAAVLFFSAQFVTDFYGLCTLLFLGSFSADLLRPALFSGLSYITDASTQTRAISLMRMAFNLGIAIGPAAAGVIVLYTGYQAIFTIDALTCLGAAIFLWFVLDNYALGKESTKKEESQNDGLSPYRDIAFLVFLLSNLLVLIAFFQILSTIPLYIKDVLSLTEQEVGLFFTVNGLIIFFFEMPLIRSIEKKGVDNFRVLVAGGLMMGVALLGLILPTAYFVPIIIYAVLVSFGEIINFPFISTTALNRSSKGSRGSYMGLTTMVFSLALVLAPIIGTQVLESHGFNMLWIVMGSINFIGVLGYFVSKRMLEATA